MPICPRCQASFEVHEDEKNFLEKLVFTFGSTKVHLPSGKECPECRLQIRTSHRNERFMYRRKSALSGKELISLYSDPKITLYSQEEWRSDVWDPLIYGRDFDFSSPFFGQFSALQRDVPRMALITIGNENSEYSTGTAYCKNCYLINSSEYCEDCYYGKLFQKCTSCMDCAYIYNSQLCYECFSVYNCYGCTLVSFSKNCTDCHFSSQLTSCKNCLLCTNLHQKDYHVRNQKVSKGEYERLLADFRSGSHQKTEQAKAELATMRSNSIHRFANILNCEDCSGDYIENAQRCHDCYDVNESQDCRYVTVGVNVKDNYDCSNMYLKPELCFMTLGTIEVYGSAYCLYAFHSQNLLYCEYCFSCKDCFGCSGLTRKQYCIFNTQYSKEEYQKLVPKIIESMQKSGEFGAYFPPALSPFGYNETLANEYVPLTKDQAVKAGFKWHDVTDEILKVEKTILAAQLPDATSDIPDDVLNWAIKCELSGRPYRIQKPELSFYRQQKLPLPHLHPDVRYDERMKLRNARKLWKRKCEKCGKEVQTTYSKEMPEKIYCEECYLKEVY